MFYFALFHLIFGCLVVQETLVTGHFFRKKLSHLNVVEDNLMAGIDSENDEDIDVISASEDRRQIGLYGCTRDLNSFPNNSLSIHHFGNMVKQTGTQEFAGYQPKGR